MENCADYFVSGVDQEAWEGIDVLTLVGSHVVVGQRQGRAEYGDLLGIQETGKINNETST